MPDRAGSLFVLPLPFEGARICGTVSVEEFVSRVHPRPLVVRSLWYWPRPGPVCYGRSIAVVALCVLRLSRRRAP